MPATSAPERKTTERFSERDSQANASNIAAAKIQPTYFVPAMPPARTPQAAARAGGQSARARAVRRAAVTAKKAIHRSGTPAVEICQKTTGFNRKANAASKAHSRETHRRARHATPAAVNILGRYNKPMASFSLPRASPVRISKWPCPVRKLLVIKKSG